MTQDQANQLIALVTDLVQMGRALGMVLGTCAFWLQALAILLLGVLFFQALRRS